MQTVINFFIRILQIILLATKLRLDQLLFSRNYLLLLRWISKVWYRKTQLGTARNRGDALNLMANILGPVFIKLGQIISIRPDLFPADIIMELQKLQDQVQPFSSQQARNIVASQLGDGWEKQLTNFNDNPLASASIAQVHAAMLNNQQAVVIKIKRPDINKLIADDMLVIRVLAKSLHLIPAMRRYRLPEVVKLLAATFADELNFIREAANAKTLKYNFAESNKLYIPTVYPELSTNDILVMEQVAGVPINDVDGLRAHNVDVKKLAKHGVEIFFTQAFRDGFFHADMHPGNILVDVKQPELARYIAVDFGIVGILPEHELNYLAEIFIAFFKRDFFLVAVLHQRVGWLDYTVDPNEFADAVRVLSEPIFEQPLAEISFAKLLMQLFKLGRKFQMRVEPKMILFQKTLFQVEGLGKQIDPQLNFWEIARPFFNDWQQQRLLQLLNPLNNTKEIKDFFTQIPKLPSLLSELSYLLATQQQQLNKQSTKISNKYFWFGIVLVSCGWILLLS